MLDAFARMNEASPVSVFFQRERCFDAELDELVEKGVAAGNRFVYVDIRATLEREHLANSLGRALGLNFTPYTQAHWLKFLDGLRGLAFNKGGLVLLVDGGWMLFEPAYREDLMELIEVFQYEARHWRIDGRPCALILQMLPDPEFARVFGRFAT